MTKFKVGDLIFNAAHPKMMIDINLFNGVCFMKSEYTKIDMDINIVDAYYELYSDIFRIDNE